MAKFLDPQYLHRLEGLSLAVSSLAHSREIGRRRAIGLGTSVEFADYRLYQPGDDTRYIDWNAYARLGRLFLRLFRAESELTVHILLDVSQSMDFGLVNKLDFAKSITMALGYVGLKNLDRIGLAVFSDHLEQVLAPRRGHRQILRLIKALEQIGPRGQSDFLTPFEEHVELDQQRGIVIVLSDLYSPSGFEEGLRILAHHHRQTVVIQIQDEQEISPLFPDGTRLVDLEAPLGVPLVKHRDSVRQYQANLLRFNESLRSFCLEQGVVHLRAITSSRFEELVLRFLESGILE